MKEIVKEAASVEEARRLIAGELGVSEDKIVFEVQQEPGKKVLGLFGGTPAVVKGTVQDGPAEMAKAYLVSVLQAMGAGEFTASLQETENGCEISLEGEDLGFIIGRRGDTLDALQCLTGLVANRADNGYFRVTLNIGNYREKREQALVSLARRLGGQTARTGRRHSLEPMNPYERRIIHGAVATVKGATSASTGVEPNRRVVISSTVPPTGGKEAGKEGGRSRSRNNRRRSGSGSGSAASGGKGGESRRRSGGEGRRGRLEDPPAIGGPVRREQAEAVTEKSGVEQELLSSAGKRYGKLDV